MTSTTPTSPSHRRSHSRSDSHINSQIHKPTTSPPPRPSTPLRPPSRSSLRSSHTPTHGSTTHSSAIEPLEPAFAEFADNMADLEANLMHVQLMHESLARFNECFASFLHGLKVNAFCVDFPEAPLPESFRRARDNPKFAQHAQQQHDDGTAGRGFNHSANSEAGQDIDQTFLTTDTSFVENPPASSVKTNKFATPAPTRSRGVGGGADAGARARARGGSRGVRGPPASSVPRGPSSRGRPSGLARASNRGRGGVAR